LDSGYYAASAGLRTQTEALDIVANNLANLNTTGYRGQQPTFHSLLATAHATSDALNRVINDFSVLGGSRLDLSPGNLTRTGNPLDLGLEGKGFFVVQKQGVTVYTRNGNFQPSAKGQLITSDGDLVLGEQGAITLPSGVVSVSADGTLSVDGAVAAKLRIVEFPPDAALVPVGSSYYSGPDQSAQPAGATYVRQDMLESANVNAVSAMVDLLSVQRQTEMLGRALSSFDSTFNRIAADDLPRV